MSEATTVRYSAREYIRDSRTRGARAYYHPTPWIYDCGSRSYSRFPYTLLVFPGGFMQRVYDE